MLDDAFRADASDLFSQSMGTEVVAPFLYNLIMFERPRKVLEIGAGYTSMYILKALFDCDSLIKEEKYNVASDNLTNPNYFNNIRQTKDDAENFSLKWKPWRTIASWYLWRSIDPEVVLY